MKYPYLFFDLDGTISNSAKGITNAVTYALEHMGITPPAKQDLMHFIGPPLIRTFTADYDLSPEDGARAVAFYREYYNVQGVYECEMYRGVGNLLKQLHEAGYRMVLATCKPAVMAKVVLEYFGISGYFEMVSGPELDGTRNEKHQVIAYALEQLGIDDPRNALMIGDRRDDVLGAKMCGLRCLGVLWGYGSEAELRESGAENLAHTTAELQKLIENWAI